MERIQVNPMPFERHFGHLMSKNDDNNKKRQIEQIQNNEWTKPYQAKQFVFR